MLHSHLTTLNAVSLILETFKPDGICSQTLLAGAPQQFFVTLKAGF